MGCVLSSPVEAIRIQRHGCEAFRVAVAEMQGWRNNHEDSHHMTCEGNRGGFWVLDGHGGDKAARSGAPDLSTTVGIGSDAEGMPEDRVIAEGFAAVDARLRKMFTEQPDWESGSTVIGCLAARKEDGTYDAKLLNCGDSRAIIVRGPTEAEKDATDIPVKVTVTMVVEEEAKVSSWPLLAESVDHKPNMPSERARIEAAGGFVSSDEPARLDGNLAVSRALGDFEYKMDKLAPCSQQKVSVVPDIYEIRGMPAGTVLVLACDGLWDVLSSVDVANYVREQIANDPKIDLGDVCAELIRMSQKLNSRDNVTVMIAHCVDGSEWAETTDHFNKSDEMRDFSKLASTDDDTRRHYRDFLTKCDFPMEAMPCAISGRWHKEMWKDPVSCEIYSTRSCQKKGWKRYKAKMSEQEEASA